VRFGLIVAVGLVLCGTAAGGGFPGGNGLVVFSRTTDQQPSLVAVDPASGTQRTLGTGTAPSFSPDGSKLAFVRNGVVSVEAARGSSSRASTASSLPASRKGRCSSSSSRSPTAPRRS
jgi:Tol biopolymer transport system component